MKKTLLYIIIFVAVQLTVTFGAAAVLKLWFPAVSPTSPTAMIIISAVTSVITLALFLGFKWCPVSRNYIRTRPWQAMIWTVLLAIGIILPLALLEEQIPESWRIYLVGDELMQMLQSTEGYFVVCMLGPLAEEVVFRGAIIRALQGYFAKKQAQSTRGNHNFQFSIFNFQFDGSFAAVIISALFFAGVHFNPAQMPHAFIVGCLLGWLFVRTNSIVPGFILHWINNSAAYVAVKMFPHMPMDAPLVSYFGSTAAVVQAVVCSLMIALPALYQLNRVMKKNNTFSTIGIVLLMLLATNKISAEDRVIPFIEEKERYFVDITVAGEKVHAMLETGASAFNMSEDFYETHKDSLNLTLKPVGDRMVSDLETKKGYNVLYAGIGTFSIGEVLYHGQVIVTDKPRKYQVLPVQCLHHPSDSSSIIVVDPFKHTLTFKEKAFRYELANKKWTAYPLHRNKKSIKPLLTTTVKIELNHKEYSIQGDFMVDMGCANHLVLSENDKQVVALIDSEEDAIKQSRDDRGHVNGLAFKCERLKLNNDSFHDIWIYVKKKYYAPNSKWTGLIGLKAFRGKYAFDWGRNTLYVR